MKVLLSDTWAGGGASTFVATLARNLSRRGHDVDVIVGYRDSPAVADYAATVRAVFRPPVEFNRIVLNGDYDVLHVTEDDLHPPFDYARRVRRLGLRTRVVVTAHQEWARVAPGTDVAVYVSDASLRKAPNVAPGSHVIPNGVDVGWLTDQADDLLLTDDGPPVAIWVGRVEDPLAQKDFRGFGYAIDGFLRLGWSVLVLDGSPPSASDPAAAQLRRWFGDRVHYDNQVPNATVAGALLRAGRRGGALVSTSRYEAAPFIALEALALGCPVVAPTISGYAALFEAGYATGYESLPGLLDVIEHRAFSRARVGVPEGLTAADMTDRYLEIYTAGPGRKRGSGVRSKAMRAGVRSMSHPRARTALSAVRTLRGRAQG